MAGAGLINAIFLPRASAVIEIRPLGFDATHAFTWPRWFEKRLQYFHELMYFSICIYDKDLSAKGPLEGDTSGTNVVATTRDRSVILPPAYLFAVLDEFRSFGGNMSLYDGAATTKLCTAGWRRLVDEQIKAGMNERDSPFPRCGVLFNTGPATDTLSTGQVGPMVQSTISVPLAKCLRVERVCVHKRPACRPVPGLSTCPPEFVSYTDPKDLSKMLSRGQDDRVVWREVWGKKFILLPGSNGTAPLFCLNSIQYFPV